MPEPTLVQIFGSEATQSATQLTISKTPMVNRGLTASASNTAESLFVSTLLVAADHLTSANQLNNADQNIVIEKSFESITQVGDVQYREVTYNVRLRYPDPTATIDPDLF